MRGSKQKDNETLFKVFWWSAFISVLSVLVFGWIVM